MGTSAKFSVTWSQALARRLERHLLDPVGSEPAHERPPAKLCPDHFIELSATGQCSMCD
jgi:hypothetical protein